MAGASMETCQFVVLRSPRGRLGSLLDVRERLHRTRGGFHRCIHISMVSSATSAADISLGSSLVSATSMAARTFSSVVWRR